MVSPGDDNYYSPHNERRGVPYLGTLVPLHRADFHEVLLRHLPETCRTHTSKRLRSYTQHSSPGSPIELHFADGSSSQCDVLIGADGLKSAVRHSLCTEKAAQAERDGRPEDAAEARSAVDPLWSGMTVYRALIPAEKLTARAPGHQVLETPTQVCSTNLLIRRLTRSEVRRKGRSESQISNILIILLC